MSRAFATIPTAPAVPPVESGLWFHGDSARRTTFLDQKDRNRGEQDPNAYGPGSYWSRREWQARGYASPGGWLYTARMKTTKVRTVTDASHVTEAFLGKLIDVAPDQENLLNFDENPRRARAKAIAGYVEEKALDAILGVFHDIYAWDDQAFLPALVKLGYDCYVHGQTGNMVVWNGVIVKVEKEEKYESKGD